MQSGSQILLIGPIFSQLINETFHHVAVVRIPDYLLKDGEVVSSESLTKSALWDSATVWGSHPPVG